MANIILFDNEVRDQLLPFTFTRPVCELRVGLLTIREKWARWFSHNISYITQDYLAEKYPMEYGKENFVINGSVMPSEQLCTLLSQMEFSEAFLRGEELIAAKLDEKQFEKLIQDEDIGELRGIDVEDTHFLKINNLCDIVNVNGAAIREDFELLIRGRQSLPLGATNRLSGDPASLFIEPGARLEGTTINTAGGPVYIGKDAEIMEGTLIRGPLALGEGAILKMGTRIYGPTTVGPYCRVGGEVKNSVIFANSNKSHDGYLGNSVIGEWCNLGADTNASNLKNTFSEVSLWSYAHKDFYPTGEQFCGLFMGDHSRSGINTMFNTGTVVGVAANVFGPGFPRRFLPSFSWGGAANLQTFRPDKAFESIENMMGLRGQTFSVEDRIIILRIFEETARYRFWEGEG